MNCGRPVVFGNQLGRKGENGKGRHHAGSACPRQSTCKGVRCKLSCSQPNIRRWMGRSLIPKVHIKYVRRSRQHTWLHQPVQCKWMGEHGRATKQRPRSSTTSLRSTATVQSLGGEVNAAAAAVCLAKCHRHIRCIPAAHTVYIHDCRRPCLRLATSN